jgi:molybdopterin-guanine dinucleotide biosynthesis protein A
MKSHQQSMGGEPSSQREPLTGIILAGGKSSRIATNKALLKVKERPIIFDTYETFTGIFSEILIITNTPQAYESIQALKSKDIITGKGPLGGVFTGLSISRTQYNFVVACDMPFLNPGLIRYMLDKREGFDVVVPRSGDGCEPLHAVYSKACLGPIRKHLEDGDLQVQSFYDEVSVAYIRQSEIEQFDPEGKAFMNINDRSDLQKVRDVLKNGDAPSWGD